MSDRAGELLVLKLWLGSGDGAKDRYSELQVSSDMCSVGVHGFSLGIFGNWPSCCKLHEEPRAELA